MRNNDAEYYSNVLTETIVTVQHQAWLVGTAKFSPSLARQFFYVHPTIRIENLRNAFMDSSSVHLIALFGLLLLLLL